MHAPFANQRHVEGLWSERHQAVSPLHELLKTLGLESSRQALAEECQDDFSLAAMTECIQRRGLRGRVVSIVESDLPALGVTLIELQDQSTALLRSDAGRRCCVELANGSIVRGRQNIAQIMGRQAIEIDTNWSGTGSFLARILRICSGDARVRGALVLFCISLFFRRSPRSSSRRSHSESSTRRSQKERLGCSPCFPPRWFWWRRSLRS